MPNYQANCKKGHPFEVFQSFSDYDRGAPLICPAHNLEGTRLISKPMINGTSSFKLGENSTIQRELEVQLGVKRGSITSAKQVDQICKEKGLQMVDKDWQPSASIIKNREEAGIKKMEESMMKELSQHSSVILPDGTEQSLGI